MNKEYYSSIQSITYLRITNIPNSIVQKTLRNINSWCEDNSFNFSIFHPDEKNPTDMWLVVLRDRPLEEHELEFWELLEAELYA